MAALFDGTSATGDDQWAPAMDGVPADIITDMDSSFYSLNGYDDTPSPNQTNSQPTMREDATTSNIGPDVTMANIRRKRPMPSTKGSNNAVDDCIIELAASVKASNQLAAAFAQSEGPTVEACIDLLHEMPQLLETSPLHMVALRSFMVKERRIIWTKFKTDEGKITWLKSLMEIEKGNASDL
eukprot:TRINITY_DN5016_c0_g1_i1.p1 TRINITY_DN5016_c0_g1~~TRINITY_DN5016_c0_g1_i1.p1  ORF type:complete len:183 (+),score=36.79 TRINITY_DN5016_c0_g1_i1:495-1043(+)